MADQHALHQAILTGDHVTAKSITAAALAEGAAPLALVQDVMMPAMAEAGRKFEANEYYVPQLLLAARAMKVSLELIRPLLAEGAIEPAGRIAIGTVKGDLHDIGKNLVAAMLEGGGYEVIDLGVNVDPAKFVRAVKEKNVGIIALSALLTTTMPAMKTTIAALQQAGLRDRVKIMVGGAPVTERYAKEIGADGYSANAAGAVNLARTLHPSP
jgi:5-methyltetrahydrofolate--homocysteine methyltransferase